jgi:hypothetical protein
MAITKTEADYKTKHEMRPDEIKPDNYGEGVIIQHIRLDYTLEIKLDNTLDNRQGHTQTQDGIFISFGLTLTLT